MPGMRRRGAGPGPRRAGPGPSGGRRRRRRRQTRRIRRRRVIIGGALVFAAGSAVYKLTKKDADKIEETAGKPVDQMSEEEVEGYMDQLGIEEQEVSDSDLAAIESEEEPAGAAEPAPAIATEPTPAGVDQSELEQLADLHAKGILTDEEFEAKKKQILGI